MYSIGPAPVMQLFEPQPVRITWILCAGEGVALGLLKDEECWHACRSDGLAWQLYLKHVRYQRNTAQWGSSVGALPEHLDLQLWLGFEMNGL